ncbi:MAG: S-layer family protein [Flavobacteriales bacterium]|nr:S-layer family protein [Flavobacteriales bacterium]
MIPTHIPALRSSTAQQLKGWIGERWLRHAATILLLAVWVYFGGMSVCAQISVTATAGNTGPTSYANLRLAFAAVNDGTHQGVVTIDITSSPGADNNTAVLNASGSGSANYTNLVIQPAGSTGARSISGTVNAGPLVDLNGADNVTFDGRNGDGYTLTISNHSTASSAGTSTIRFINDATDNSLRDLSILGRSTGTVATLSGNVVFSTGSSTGNDDNTLANCIIANDGNSTTDLISKALVSVGSTGSLALHNSGNVVEDCQVHDFFLAGGSRGILLGAGNHAWTISGNRFWQGAARTTAANSSQHVVVDITSGSHADAGGHVITGNVIGFANAAGTGTWTLSGGSNLFRAIRMDLDANAPACTISANAIGGLDHASTHNGTGSSSPSTLIHVLGGPVSITDNQIGTQGATGSIVFTPSAAARDFHAILNSGSAPWTSHHNRFGGIIVANSGALYALRSTGTGTWACDSNLVGGTVAASLEASGTGSGAKLFGVASEGAPINAAGNTLRNMVSAGNSGSYIRGISVADAAFSATGNVINTLACSGIDGIHGSNARATITANNIAHLSGTNTGMMSPLVRGIFVSGDSATVANNSISTLSSMASGSSTATYGIHGENGVLIAHGNIIADLNEVRLAAGIQTDDAELVAENNTISHIAARFSYGIRTLHSTALLTGNDIRFLSTNATSGSPAVCGISATDGLLTTHGNVIAHLSNAVSTNTAITNGIQAINTSITGTSNLIHHLSGDGSGTAGIVGITGITIANTSGANRVVLQGNTLHTLFSSHPDNVGQVHGIHATLYDTTNIIEGNLIHSLWRSTSSTSANPARAIYLLTGTSSVRNNMIRLGLDSAGASVNSPHVFQGIHVADGTHAILHNTVYIGGTATAASSNHTYALFSATTGARDHRNNILWNARSTTGSARHYAVGVNADLTGLVSDHNCLHVSGSGGHVGREGTTDRTTLSAWQSATSLDGNSISVDPGLVRPGGDATEVDLHIQHNSAGAASISRAGASSTGVLHDYDGAQRHSPPDIGADQILLVLADFYEENDQPSFNYWRNKGQVVDTEHNQRSDVKFYTDQGLPRTYLRSGSIISFTHTRVDTVFATPDTTWRVDLRFTGGKERAVDPQPVDMRDPYRNYYLPWCGPNGATQVHGFGRVVYEDLYPYTDLHFYSGSGGPKLAFVIRPGGDMDNIQLEFEGQDSLTVDANGVLHAHVSGWDFPLIGGIAYQVNGSTIIPVGLTTYLNSAGSPVVEIGMSSFSMPLDTELPLVIMAGWPPMMGGQVTTDGVCWSTYLGGDGRDAVEDSDVDEEGNYYVVGHTFSQDIYFPIGDGQVYYQASPMAFASKFGTGYEIRWSTFYGGSFGWQAARCARVRPGADPNLLVGGFTNANDLWSSPPNDDRYYDPSSSRGGFLAEFNAEGEAVWSTYIGDGAWSVLDVDLHPNGNFAIVGSAEWFLPEEQETPDPTADHWGYSGTLDQNYPGDGFITLFNADRRTIWSTYIGGNYGDAVETVRFGTQKIVIAGQTTSTNLPLKEDGGQDALNEDYQGNGDVFIMEFDLVGRQIWSTYFGGGSGESIGDQGLALQPVFDNGREDIFIVGMSSSDDLDLENGPNWHDETYKPGLQGYILRINGEDRTIEWLTHVKGLGAIQRSTHLNTVLVDALGRIFVAGLSWDPTFVLEPGFGIYSADAMYGVGDGVILCFSNEQELRWSTYFGGDEGGLYGDDIRTLALAGTQRLYAAGTTYSAFGPTSFFPFTDPVGDDDWFDDTFFPEMDGFLAAFCIEDLLISVAEAVRPTSNAGFTVQYAPEGWYQLVGLPLGTHRWSVLDVRGRAVLDRSSMVGEAPLRFDLDGSAPGIYLVHVPGIGAQRLVHQP